MYVQECMLMCAHRHSHTPNILLIHSSIKGFLGCFCVLDNMNNICILLILLDIYPEMELLAPMLILLLIFDVSQYVFHSNHLICIFNTVYLPSLSADVAISSVDSRGQNYITDSNGAVIV